MINTDRRARPQLPGATGASQPDIWWTQAAVDHTHDRHMGKGEHYFQVHMLIHTGFQMHLQHIFLRFKKCQL